MEDEQELVAAVLRSMPPADADGGFVARVNARIDDAPGWLGLADFRAWTLGLAPAACALALVAVFWQAPSSASAPALAPASASASASAPASASAVFSPASSTDWQKDVSADALLEAALAPEGKQP